MLEIDFWFCSLCKKEHVKINRDISFVSFANLPICHYIENPPVASVEQFPYQQGEKAAEILFKLLETAPDKKEDEILHQFIFEPKLEIH